MSQVQKTMTGWENSVCGIAEWSEIWKQIKSSGVTQGCEWKVDAGALLFYRMTTTAMKTVGS